MSKKTSIKGAVRHAKVQDARDRAAHAKAVGVKTSDSFQNFMTGLGIGTSNATSASTYGFNPITRQRTILEWIHRGSWLGGIAVDVVADDMTRAGIKLTGEIEPEDIEKLNEEANKLQIWQQINQVIKWARLYGGCLGVMMIDGQKTETPLNIDRVGEDQFKGIMVLDRWMVQPTLEDLVTEYGPHMGLPKYYDVVADAPALRRMRIHHSRCLRLDGVELPYWQRLQENLWSISVYERLYDRMIAFDSATTGAAQLVYKSYIRTYKLEGLREIIAAGGKALQALMQQVSMMRTMQGIEGITLLDAKDEFEGSSAASASFAGIADALVQFGQQLAGALQIPLVRLFGQSPAGLNSTGESDLRMYYDGIKQQQETKLRVPLTSVYRMMAQSIGVKLPEGFGLQFRPLWQLTEAEKIELAAQLTTAVVQAEEAGVVKRSTGLKELKQGSDTLEVWSNIDQEEIEQAEQELPPSVEEALSAAQEGGVEGEGSATDAILGPDPMEGGGDDANAPNSKPAQGSKTKDAATAVAGVQGGTGGPHKKWEETKHARAGKGQTIGKSKGGQFTAMPHNASQGATGAKGNAGAEQPKPEPVQTAQLRRKFREMERELRAKHPDWKQEQIIGALMKTQEVPNTEGQTRPGARFGGERRGPREMDEKGNLHRRQFGRESRGEENIEADRGPLEKLAIAGRGQRIIEAWMNGDTVREIAQREGLMGEDVRTQLRQAGLWKEFGGFANGHEKHVPVNPDALKKQRFGGQQTLIRQWFAKNPEGGTWGHIANAIQRGGKLQGVQGADKVVKHYLNEWRKKGWLSNGKALPQPVKAEQIPIEQKLATSPITGAVKLGHGITNPYKITFDDGSKAVFKPKGGFGNLDMERELGAWEVAKIIGMQDLMMPVVYRKNVKLPGGVGAGRPTEGVVIGWTNGKMAMNFNGDEKYDGARDRNRAAVFDFVLANSDRHEGNWMVDNGHLVLIDHGATFAGGGGWGMGGVQERSFITKAKNSGDNLAEYIKPYVDNKEKIAAKMKELGMVDEQVKGVLNRIDILDRNKNNFAAALDEVNNRPARVAPRAAAPVEKKPAREPKNTLEKKIWDLHKAGKVANQIGKEVNLPVEKVREIRKELRGF